MFPAFVRGQLIALLALLTACSSLIHTPTEPPQPETGASEERLFRYLVLDNGLRVLLISDPEARKAAAALDVEVGSREDPEDFQGLSHFLEHMLFLGTDRYPVAGDYQNFISSNGGNHNAYTAFERTNYFFEVNAPQLEPALDRFSRFFVAPLFNAEYVAREVKAVESEYRARINNDYRRRLDVLKALADSQHPFSGFSVGNIDTLMHSGEQALRDALLAHYQQYYVAQSMALVVSGPQSLAELESLVRARFADVPQGEAPLTEAPVNPFSERGLPLWVDIDAVKEIRELSVSFPLPQSHHLYLEKPLYLIGHLLGHEGPGSLLSELKRRGWAERLSAGSGFEFRGGTLFGVEIGLTPLGVEHRDQVIGLLFDQIERLRAQGVDQWRFDELAELGELQFAWRSKPDPVGEASELAGRLREVAPRHILSAPFLYADYQPDLIAEFLNGMQPGNALISYTGNGGVSRDRRTALYDTAYGLRSVTADAINTWRKRAKTDALTLPEPNPFIVEQPELKTLEAGFAQPQPVLVPGVDLWYLGDTQFREPKGAIKLLMLSDEPVTAKRVAIRKLWAAMVQDELNEIAYDATLAGLEYRLGGGWRGLSLRLQGYDGKQAILLRRILQTLSAPAADEARFERLRQQRLRGIRNESKVVPYRGLQQVLGDNLRLDRFDRKARLAAMSSVTLADVINYVPRFLPSAFPVQMVQGNFTEAEAQDLAAIVAAVVGTAGRPLPAVATRVLDLEGESRWQAELDHTDSGTVFYTQALSAGKRERVAVGVAAQMLGADFYTALRTEKQLGYVVSAWPWPLRDISGLVMVVQSPVVSTAKVQAEMEHFFTQWLALPDLRQKYEINRAGLAQRLLEPPANLAESAGRHWQQLLDGEHSFDVRQQLAGELATLSFEDWYAIIEPLLLPASRNALWLFSPGRFPSPETAGPAEQLPAFRRSGDAWHFPVYRPLP